jgi:hypothetical protein
VLLTLGARDQIGAPGAPFNRPTHAVQAPNGDIVVSDGYGQNRIHRFSATGEHILSFGSGNVAFGIENPGTPSTGPGELNVPHDVVVDSDSHLIVSDRENHRLQFFTLDGAYLREFGVTHPNKIQIDADGILHIGGGAGVEVWKKDGTRLGSWGETGSEPGQFVRGSIHGIWLDAEGSIYTVAICTVRSAWLLVSGSSTANASFGRWRASGRCRLPSAFQSSGAGGSARPT